MLWCVQTMDGGEPVFECWSTVCAAGRTFNQHWVVTYVDQVGFRASSTIKFCVARKAALSVVIALTGQDTSERLMDKAYNSNGVRYRLEQFAIMIHFPYIHETFSLSYSTDTF